MPKKQTLADRQHKTNLKLLWGSLLFFLFTLSVATMLYLIDHGGIEVLTALRQ